jgi:hypothetical protein
MASRQPYKLLRTKTGFTDDTDFAGTQTAPAASDTKIVAQPDRADHYVRRGVQLEFLLEFVDNSNVVIAGAASYTLSVIRTTSHLDAVPPAVSVVASAPVTVTAKAHVPLIFPDVKPGDDFSVRLTGITEPATATKVNVYYREIQA